MNARKSNTPHVDAAKKLGGMAALMENPQTSNPYDMRAEAECWSAWLYMFTKVTADLRREAIALASAEKPNINIIYNKYDIDNKRVVICEVGVYGEDDWLDYVKPAVMADPRGDTLLIGRGDDRHEAVYLGCFKLKEYGWTDTQIEKLEDELLDRGNQHAHNMKCCRWEKGKGSTLVGCQNYYYLAIFVVKDALHG